MKLLNSSGATVAESTTVTWDETYKMWLLADGSGISDPDKHLHVATEELSPVEFKLRLTAQERVAIHASTDPVVVDFLRLIDDPRLTTVHLSLPSVIEAMQYLEAHTLIGIGRAAQILA